MESPFDTADHYLSQGMLGPRVALILTGDYSFTDKDVAEALREHGFEVHTDTQGNLKSVSDYPKGHSLYKPLQRGTGELRPPDHQSDRDRSDLEKLYGSGSESPYHHLSEDTAPLPVLSSYRSSDSTPPEH